MSVLIKGGRIVTASEDYIADIFIENERISLIGTNLKVNADKVIDAKGKYVLPGAIDPHTHIEFPFGATTTCDTWTSATTAAAAGGTTTVVDFCVQTPGKSLAHALDAWHGKMAKNKPVIDVGFHMAITDLKKPETMTELAKIGDAGITSYKLFMAYKGAVMVDDTTLFKVLRQGHEKGALTMVHAENGDAIDVLVKEAQAKKQTAPKYHALTRPVETEAEATNRAIQLARIADAALYVVHVSCKQSIAPIATARENDWNIHGETCPQYLFFDESYLDKPNFEGAKWVYTPPPRAKEHQDHLWHALNKDVLSVISTDHCPFNWKGQKSIGKKDFAAIPNGGVGIEDRLRLIHHYGVNEGRISLNRMVELLSTAPAKYFGLYPRKGTVSVGADADLVIFDPKKSWTISQKTSHCLADHNLYEGRKVKGTPVATLVRGKVVVEDNKLVAAPGHGEFIKRANFGEKLLAKGK